MKKLLILLMIALLAAQAYGQELQSLKTGKYTVEGKSIFMIGEQITIPANEAVKITWTAGKDDLCKGQCSLKISGFECSLTKEGTCKGVSKGKMLLVFDEKTANERKEDLDFGKNTQLTYGLANQQFALQSKKFTFAGKQVSSESELTIIGNRIIGETFSVGDIEANYIYDKNLPFDQQFNAEITVYPNSVVAGQHTHINYKGIELFGRNDDYEFCLSEKGCVTEKSYAQLYSKGKEQYFHAVGKEDGGPQIIFSSKNPILQPVASGDSTIGDSKFSINNLEDSELDIRTRKGEKLIPQVNLKVMSQKKFTAAGIQPPVVLLNGRTTMAAFADDYWIKGESERVISAKGGEVGELSREIVNSMPMALTVEPDILKSRKILINAYNGVGVISSNQIQGKTIEQISDLPPSIISESLSYNNKYASKEAVISELKEKFANIEKIEGFNYIETNQIRDILNRLPPTLTTTIKSIKYVSNDEAASEDCDQSCNAWADTQGNIVLKKQGIRESTIYHELAHAYLRTLEYNSPENTELAKKYDKVIYDIEKAEIEGEDTTNMWLDAAPIIAEKEKMFTGIPLVKEWMSANEEVRTATTDVYCKDKIKKDKDGFDVWADDGGIGPRYGIIRPYGCKTFDEDIATYVAEVYKNPDKLRSQATCPPPNAYAKKIYLMNKYGLVDNQQYGVILPRGIRDCIRGNIK